VLAWNSCSSHIVAADSRLSPRRVQRTQRSTGLNARQPCWTAHPPKPTWRAQTSHRADPRQNTYATRSWTSKEGRNENFIFQSAILAIFFYTDIFIRPGLADYEFFFLLFSVRAREDFEGLSARADGVPE
jgi:hypothetical protein